MFSRKFWIKVTFLYIYFWDMDISLHDFSPKNVIKTLRLILNPKEVKKLTSYLIFSGFCLFAFTKDIKNMCVCGACSSLTQSHWNLYIAWMTSNMSRESIFFSWNLIVHWFLGCMLAKKTNVEVLIYCRVSE